MECPARQIRNHTTRLIDTWLGAFSPHACFHPAVAPAPVPLFVPLEEEVVVVVVALCCNTHAAQLLALAVNSGSYI